MRKEYTIIYCLKSMLDGELVSSSGLVMARNLKSAHKKLVKIFKEPKCLSLMYADSDTSVVNGTITTEGVESIYKQLKKF